MLKLNLCTCSHGNDNVVIVVVVVAVDLVEVHEAHPALPAPQQQQSLVLVITRLGRGDLQQTDPVKRG